MLVGAVTGFVTIVQTGSAAAGVLAAALAGAAAATRSSRGSSIDRRANQLATGLALMFAGVGLSALLGAATSAARSPGSRELPVPGLWRACRCVGPRAVLARRARVRRGADRRADALGALLDALGAGRARGGREPGRRVRGRPQPARAAIPGAAAGRRAGRHRRRGSVDRRGQDVGGVDDRGARLHRGRAGDLRALAARCAPSPAPRSSAAPSRFSCCCRRAGSRSRRSFSTCCRTC